jgi:hypothetical protein
VAGDSAREVTTAALSALGDDWCVMTGVGWPSRDEASIDHVVVGPGGVFVIDSRHWSGRLEMREDGLRQNGRLRNDATSATTSAALAVSDVLDLDVDAVYPVLCLVREDNLSGWAGDVFVTTPQDLAGELTTCPPVLGPDEVARLRGLATVELAPATSVATPVQGHSDPHREPVTSVVMGDDVAAVQKPGTARAGSRRTRVSGLVGLMMIVAAAGIAVVPNLGGAAASRTQATGELGDTIDIVGAKSRPDLQLIAANVLPAKGVGHAARPGKGMRLVEVRFEIQNIGAQGFAGRGLTSAVTDEAGRTYGPVARVTHMSAGPLLPHRVNLRPGRLVRGWVVFEVPRRAHIETVTLSVAAGAPTATWSAPEGS